VDADAWSEDDLRNVISTGEALLNISFPEAFKKSLIEQALGSVYIVQDCCYRACKQNNIHETANEYLELPQDLDAKKAGLGGYP
jgi:hypothetical protein